MSQVITTVAACGKHMAKFLKCWSSIVRRNRHDENLAIFGLGRKFKRDESWQ